jgi:hypothetical protein
VHPLGRWALHRHDVPRRPKVQAEKAKTETCTWTSRGTIPPIHTTETRAW